MSFISDSRSRPVNDDGTLVEVNSRDIWQCEVVTTDGTTLGRAVSEIIEPQAYSVRYLVVFDPVNGRRLLPAALVCGAHEDQILCAAESTMPSSLPPYTEPLSREVENRVHEALDCWPYWKKGPEDQPGAH